MNKFDTEREKRARKNRGFEKKAYDWFLDIYSASKGLWASIDFSAIRRQGEILTVNNPIQALKALKIMVTNTFSEKKHENWMNAVKNTEEYYLMKKAGLYLGETNAKLSAKEEEIMSNLPERIPILGKYLIKPSNRAFLAYLNALKIAVFNKQAKALIDMGYDPNKNIKQFQDLAKFINNATGRGSLGRAEGLSTFLNAGFFSAKFTMSRLQLLSPRYYMKLEPGTRKFVIKNMLTFLTFKMTILWFLYLLGADIEKDMTSPLFGKAVFGKYHFDIWAGFQQPVRHLFNMILGRKKTSAGISKKVDRFMVPWDFAMSKVSPTTGWIRGVSKGKDFLGRDFDAGIEFGKLFIPSLAGHEIYSAAKEGGLIPALVAAYTNSTGIGFSYYGSLDPIFNGVEDGLPFEKILSDVQKEKGQLHPSTVTRMMKKYRAYRTFGLEDKIVQVLLMPGIKNENKAQYFIDEKVSRQQLNKYLEAGLVSEEFVDTYNEIQRKRFKKG